MSTILIAPDKYKGTLTANEVADIIADTIHPLNANIVIIPMADGGEGTSAAIGKLAGMSLRFLPGMDSTMRPIPEGIPYYINDSTRVCTIDSSATLGLSLIGDTMSSPMKRTSYPLGKLIREIVEKENPTLLYIGVGGTSTVDGGAGLLQALGYRFYNGTSEIPIPITASMLPDITTILPPETPMPLPSITALSDVAVPLVAPDGHPSSLSFASQKGAKQSDIETLRNSLAHFSSLMRELKPTASEFDGAGGGLCFAFSQIGARITRGAEHIIKLADIPAIDPDLIITGEGSLDSQTALGKVVSALASYGSSHRIPVVAVCGRIIPGFDIPGLTAVFSTQLYPPQGCLNIRKATMRLRAASQDLMRWIAERGF